MYAALMFKGTHSDGSTCYAVERRQMGCFNGLNTADAFSGAIARPELFIKMPPGSNTNPRLYENAPSDFPRMDQMTLLGLGWFTDLNCSVADLRSVINRFDFDLHLLEMLNMERCSELYQSIHGNHKRTLRELTDNEREISQVLRRVYAMAEGTQWTLNNNSIFNKNLIAGIFALNNRCYGALMDWVGSERSSGMAVAYLQVFRNTSRVAFSHAQNAVRPNNMRINRKLHDLIFDRDGRKMVNIKSMIPILSRMYNNGSDSDIFSFASNPVIPLFATKHGIFAMSQSFRNTLPMAEEGRYNKGGQSDHIASAFNRIRGINTIPATFRVGGSNVTVGNYMEFFQHFKSNLREFERLTSVDYIFGGTDSDYRSVLNNIESVAQRLRSYDSKIVQGGRNFFALAEETPDVRVPFLETPASHPASENVNGASLEYTQWVSTQGDGDDI